MKSNKKNILEKIVKKDYKNELEKVLEQKKYTEHAKSTLLSILYKIEASYKDYETVKKNIETKEEYIENLLKIINNNCDLIKIIRMNDKDNKILGNKTYIIDKEQKTIISYPIERKILYAIAKISKKEKIIKDEYPIINETLSNLINVGHNINMVEPLRDFNGYSWTTIPQEIESIDHNLVYQNLRMIIGQKFLNKWINNNEFIIDYFDLFKDKLDNLYGKEIKNEIIDNIIKISILLDMKFNKQKCDELTKAKEEIEEKLEEIKDKEKYLEKITQEKNQITKEIKKIDKTINNKELLEKEYKKRNEKLPLNKKVFSMRILSQIMEKEREEKINKLEDINKIMTPKHFVEYEKELEKRYKYLKILNVKNEEKQIEKSKTKLQEIFFNILNIKIKNAEKKQEIEEIIYDFRYYLMLNYDYNTIIADKIELKEYIEKTTKLIIQKSIENKVIQEISEDKETNYEILKNIFNIRIIKLKDAYLKITKEKDKYFMQIFDENIIEEKLEISKPKSLKIKTNKKCPFWTVS